MNEPRKKSIEGMSEKELRSYRGTVGKWINQPQIARRWVLVQHGLIVQRIGRMVLSSEYETRAALKDDLREFQDWAGAFMEMLEGFRAKEDERKRSRKEPKEASESLPWRGERPGSIQ